jgi:hypothetical protein
MNGVSRMKTTKMMTIFGTKASVISWICVSAWNSEITRPITSAAIMIGPASLSMTIRLSRPISTTSAASIGDALRSACG